MSGSNPALFNGLPFVRHDGGRAAAGFEGKAGDCLCRAAAIASGRSYLEVYELINSFGAKERTGKRKRGKSSARTGVYNRTARKVMEALGFTWTPTMAIGSGCKIHMRPGELPEGRLVVNLSRHFAAVIDGTVYDTYDPCREGTRCIYGIWRAPEEIKSC